MTYEEAIDVANSGKCIARTGWPTNNFVHRDKKAPADKPTYTLQADSGMTPNWQPSQMDRMSKDWYSE